MRNHFYDGTDGGICMNCDRCRRPECCIQTEECDGINWSFLMKPLSCDHPYVSQSWIGYSGYTHCHECGMIVEDE